VIRPDLDFTYPFLPHQGLQKQRLSFNSENAANKELLKVHKLTITVQNTRNFNRHLQQGLEHYINEQFSSASAGEKEDIEYILEDLEKETNSDFYRLRDIVNQETLGKLKKQAQINYLEFLHENINIGISAGYAEGAIYLQDLIRRLKLIEEYINDTTKADGDYLVNYAGTSVNYRDLFSRGEAFEILPIIPKIEGYLGETKAENRGEIQFIFGLKLKFDGKVQAYGGKNVFEYHLNLLNPESKEHKAGIADAKKETFARKVLKIAFLYYFLFASRNNPEKDDYKLNAELEYNPITGFEKNVIQILKGSDEAAKQQLFRNIYKYFQEFKVQRKINRLKGLLRNLIKRKTSFPMREYPLHISVKKSILEDNKSNIFNNNTFFKSVLRGNSKEVLKYISIGEAKAQTNSLCTLPAKITISDIHFFATDDRETFAMEYDLKDIRTLPVLFAPLIDKRCQEIYNQHFIQRKLILFPYSLESKKLESHQAFVYRFTFCLLAYISLRVLFDKQKMLFIPILRLHLNNKQDDAPIEKFIVSLSGVLSHLLNEKHRSNAQGIDIRDLQSKGKFKVPNVLSSLYSVFPKKFTFTNASDSPQLDKLAIVIVSSRESDRRWNSSQKISNLMGEIMGVIHKDNAVRVQLLKTFSDNYDNQQMFTYPSVVIEEVAKLYKMGFKHFLYIAKAPYSSTLHMTQTEDDDGLFFMSRDVIKALKAEHKDIKIYPMFFDKYYAVKLEKIGSSSLYIQDTIELTNLVNDPSKQSVVFFNLFNGIEVPGEQKNYNGVISYATLLNIYQGILDDEDIRKGLIFNGSLKNDILQYLTLFHFSRYQKAKDIHLKLDPYENLIGEESVGKLSLFNHMRGKSEFNSLAFLTEVKKVLNAEEHKG
jgi:ribosomal protein S20